MLRLDRTKMEKSKRSAKIKSKEEMPSVFVFQTALSFRTAERRVSSEVFKFREGQRFLLLYVFYFILFDF